MPLSNSTTARKRMERLASEGWKLEKRKEFSPSDKKLILKSDTHGGVFSSAKGTRKKQI